MISLKKQRLQGRSKTQTQSFIIKDFRGCFNNYLWQDLSHIHYKIPKADLLSHSYSQTYKMEVSHQV